MSGKTVEQLNGQPIDLSNGTFSVAEAARITGLSENLIFGLLQYGVISSVPQNEEEYTVELLTHKELKYLDACKVLAQMGYSDEAIVSLCDLYAKIKVVLPGIKDILGQHQDLPLPTMTQLDDEISDLILKTFAKGTILDALTVIGEHVNAS